MCISVCVCVFVVWIMYTVLLDIAKRDSEWRRFTMANEWSFHFYYVKSLSQSSSPKPPFIYCLTLCGYLVYIWVFVDSQLGRVRIINAFRLNQVIQVNIILVYRIIALCSRHQKLVVKLRTLIKLLRIVPK